MLFRKICDKIKKNEAACTGERHTAEERRKQRADTVRLKYAFVEVILY